MDNSKIRELLLKRKQPEVSMADLNKADRAAVENDTSLLEELPQKNNKVWGNALSDIADDVAKYASANPLNFELNQQRLNTEVRKKALSDILKRR